MKRFRKTLLTAFLMLPLYAPAAKAALEIGEVAPEFTAEASLGGKVFTFSLNKALKHGPVVLYFYPAAFTKGCTIEAHDFAEAIPKFKALGATVIGISHDTIETLTQFSVSECRSKFAVASDDKGEIMESYDAVMTSLLGVADRVSYVITPDYKILYVYQDMNPDQHVTNTLAALKAWREK